MIGITINAGKSSIWSSGINQNALYVYMMLTSIGYKCELIADKVNESMKKDISIILEGVELITFTESIKKKYDILMTIGLSLSENVFNAYKIQNKNIKLVNYKCGNDYIADVESILFNVDYRVNHKDDDYAIPDQIWFVPQQENTNLSFYKYMLGQDKATVVPFIWDPKIIEVRSKSEELEPKLDRDIKRISIMEPNISVVKNVLLPFIIVENFYKKGYDVDKLLLIGANKIKSNPRFLNIIKRSKLFKDNKITADDRHPTPYILKNFSELVLSWQWENNLNYLWLDVAWVGYPVVHNGSLCQDVGYYYEGFDAEMGADVLENVFNNFKDDVDYLDRNRRIIKRYTNKNERLKEQYKMLIEDLLNDKFKKYKYDWQKNLIY